MRCYSNRSYKLWPCGMFQRDKGSMKLTRQSRYWQTLCLCTVLLSSLITPVFSVMASGSPGAQLTAGEQAWLASYPTVRLGVDPDWPPIEFYTTEQGYQGVTSEYIRFISEQLQLTMLPKPGLSWAEALAAAKDGQVDLLPALGNTPERSAFLNFTEPYLSFPSLLSPGRARRLSMAWVICPPSG